MIGFYTFTNISYLVQQNLISSEEELNNEIKKAIKRSGKTTFFTNKIVLDEIRINQEEKTICIAVTDNNQNYGDGTAVCGKKDTWKPSVGFKIALHRAVKNLVASYA